MTTLPPRLGVASGEGAWWNQSSPVAICFLKPLKNEQEMLLGSSQICLRTLPFSLLQHSPLREGAIIISKNSPSESLLAVRFSPGLHPSSCLFYCYELVKVAPPLESSVDIKAGSWPPLSFCMTGLYHLCPQRMWRVSSIYKESSTASL